METTRAAVGYLVEEAREWGVGPRLLGLSIALPVVGGGVIAITRLHKPTFDFLTREDSVSEWLQFLGLIVVAVVAVLVARRLLLSGHRLAAAGYAGLAVAMLFVAGEEISWGSASWDSRRRRPLPS